MNPISQNILTSLRHFLWPSGLPRPRKTKEGREQKTSVSKNKGGILFLLFSLGHLQTAFCSSVVTDMSCFEEVYLLQFAEPENKLDGHSKPLFLSCKSSQLESCQFYQKQRIAWCDKYLFICSIFCGKVRNKKLRSFENKGGILCLLFIPGHQGTVFCSSVVTDIACVEEVVGQNP